MKNAHRIRQALSKKFRLGLAVNRFFAEMLGQHVVNHGTVLVALGLTIDIDHRVDGLHQRGAVAQAEFLDQEVPGSVTDSGGENEGKTKQGHLGTFVTTE